MERVGNWRFRKRRLAQWLAVVPALACVTMVVGGYFDREAERYEHPTGAHRHDPLPPPLVAIYFSGDMGLDVGTGEGAINAMRAAGVPVLAVNSSALFWRARDRAYVEQLLVQTMRRALARSGASRIALVGGSFGADILDTAIGALPADLRRRIASVVLVVPGTEVYFHANPIGVFYLGQPDSDPRRTVLALRGLPVTCIYGLAESDTLCRAPELAGSSRMAIDDGHLMFGHYRELAAITARAALFPPPMMN